MFEATVEKEKLEFDVSVLSGRYKQYAITWISNQSKFEPQVIELNSNQNNQPNLRSHFIDHRFCYTCK